MGSSVPEGKHHRGPHLRAATLTSAAQTVQLMHIISWQMVLMPAR